MSGHFMKKYITQLNGETILIRSFYIVFNPSTESQSQIDFRLYKLFNVKNGLNCNIQDFVIFL